MWADDMIEKVAALEAENAKLRAMLVRLQYATTDVFGALSCPDCGVERDRPHMPTCEIAALIGSEGKTS